jgi:geranylgeranyl diphosphate synthase, type II
MPIKERFDELTDAAVQAIENKILELTPEEPASLYEPLHYIHEAGGKRLRPVLTFLASRSNPDCDWLSAGVAVELLHTFTLIHDDIMDNANTRRGKRTLHKKYDLNTAILAGDVLIAHANQALAEGKYDDLHLMLGEFAKGFRLVCEGQALDKEFENSLTVNLAAYYHMIDLKSAKMLELAGVMGAYAAGGKYVEEIRNFAHNIGTAFQIRDDLLDLTADEALFGKTKGGDIIEGKRTYMFVKMMDRFTELTDTEQLLLRKVQGGNARLNDVPKVEQLFEEHGILADAEKDIYHFTKKGQDSLSRLPDGQYKEGLMLFSDYLLGREI